jgi:hypothetical protein
MPSLANPYFIEIEKQTKETADELKELKQSADKQPKVDYNHILRF